MYSDIVDMWVTQSWKGRPATLGHHTESNDNNRTRAEGRGGRSWVKKGVKCPRQ